MNKEKRKDPRFSCYVPVMCKKGTAFEHSQTTDISAGGAGFISNRLVPVKTKMMVEINLTPASDPVLALGEVCWVRQMAQSENFRIGLKFVEVSSAVRSQLSKCFL